jgi:uncharacterized membrane protein
MQNLGCLLLLLALMLLCLMPMFFVEAMNEALEKLHLAPQTAALAVVGIFAGGLINLPVYRIERSEPQPIEPLAIFGLGGRFPAWHPMRRDTVIAINVGGCVVPLLIAAWETSHVIRAGPWAMVSLMLAALVSILVCYSLARPVSGIGIMMPALAPPVASVVTTWLLLGAGEYENIRAGVAFVAGVLGPLVGADLFHLADVKRVPTGMLSIGGAGTFDGIVISGLVAAYFA